MAWLEGGLDSNMSVDILRSVLETNGLVKCLMAMPDVNIKRFRYNMAGRLYISIFLYQTKSVESICMPRDK